MYEIKACMPTYGKLWRGRSACTSQLRAVWSTTKLGSCTLKYWTRWMFTDYVTRAERHCYRHDAPGHRAQAIRGL